MKGTTLTLFTVAMRTAQFFIMHWMCYSPIATIHLEVITCQLTGTGVVMNTQSIVGLASHESSADKDDLKIKRHRRGPELCTQPGCPTMRPPTRLTLPTTVTNLHKTFSVQITTYCTLWCAIRHLKYSQVTGFMQSDWLKVT